MSMNKKLLVVTGAAAIAAAIALKLAIAAVKKKKRKDMESERRYPPQKLSYEDLERFTDGFSEENFIGETMFGKLYRGKLSAEQNGKELQEVTVKMWFDGKLYMTEPEEKRVRLNEEVFLLQEDKFNSHPNIARLIGYCVEGEKVGVVYDLKPLNTVFNLILEDCFTWKQRIKVAVEFARLIDFLHNEKHNSLGFIVRNIGPTHILLDEEYCPTHIDFGMLSGSGSFIPDRRDSQRERISNLSGCYGYNDPYSSRPGNWDQHCDVFAFGCVLISLFCKRVFDAKDEIFPYLQHPFRDLCDWASESFYPKFDIYRDKFPESHCSLVHESFYVFPDFYTSDAMKMTKIIIQCIEIDDDYRPTMKEVIKSLLELRVVREFADELGLKQIMRTYK